MNLLLDTCVLSEYTRAIPDPRVIDWLDRQPEPSLFISAVSIAELEKGIFKLQLRQDTVGATASRAEKLGDWLGTLARRFALRTLPVDAAVWRVWSQQAATAEADGQPIAPMDGLLMATAHCHGLTIATRNQPDFARYPHVLNPWKL